MGIPSYLPRCRCPWCRGMRVDAYTEAYHVHYRVHGYAVMRDPADPEQREAYQRFLAEREDVRPDA